MKIKVLFPQLAIELKHGLDKIGEHQLSLSVEKLEIIGRCECGQDDCGTFYTLDKRLWKGHKLRQVVPEINGLYAIDVYNESIVCIEILDRKDVVEKLNSVFPTNT